MLCNAGNKNRQHKLKNKFDKRIYQCLSQDKNQSVTHKGRFQCWTIQMLCSLVIFRNPNQLLLVRMQGDGFPGFRKTITSLDALALGAPPYTWLSAKGVTYPSRRLEPESFLFGFVVFFFKQGPFCFQNHSSLHVFRPWLKVVLDCESHSSHSSDRPQHLLFPEDQCSSCSIVCRVLRVFYFFMLKYVPMARVCLIFMVQRMCEGMPLQPHACQGLWLLYGADNKNYCICMAGCFFMGV